VSERVFTGRALLFDMDGVLVDSTKHVDLVWRQWARENGVDEDEVMAIAHGRRSLEVLEVVAPHLATPEEVVALERRESKGVADIELLPGALSLLSSLPAWSWAVVTSAGEEIARNRLRDVGLPEPPVLVSGDDIDRGKPNPDPYLAAAEALRVPPDSCIVFEDAPSGIEAAQRAGMKVVGLATTFPPEVIDAADAIARDLTNVHAAAEDSNVEVRVRTLR
jgi:mannitol-1-/sugar-/sorbitol-6-phosphatase